MPLNENSTFAELPVLDKAAVAIPHYLYATGVSEEFTAFTILAVSAISMVVIGAYATVQQPKTALDPNDDKESPLWDPSDRDGSNLLLKDAESAKDGNVETFGYKTALLMPVVSAGVLFGLDYLIRKYDVSKIVLINYYMTFVSFISAVSSLFLFTSVVARNVGYWLGLKHNSGYFIKRSRVTFSDESDLVLGAYTRIDAKAMDLSKEQLERFENFMWEKNKAHVVRLPKLKTRDQTSALVYDNRLVYIVIYSALFSTVYVFHNPQLWADYNLPTNWIINNLVASFMALNGISFMKVGNVKVAAVLLSALFLYDIYFVFKSTLMLSVATGIDIPVKIVFPRVPDALYSFSEMNSLSYKQVATPSSLLGLGDIVVPGIFAALCLRFDYHLYYKKNQLAFHKLRSIGVPKYFTAVIIAYASSLVVTISVLYIFEHGQPALLYIVPFTLAAAGSTALISREFKELWNYSEELVKYEAEKSKKDKKKNEKATVEKPIEVVATETLYEFEDLTDESDDTFLIDDESTDADADSDISDLETELTNLIRDQDVDVEFVSVEQEADVY
ncbi:hypothetical protein FT663_01219 [Candidozyma haemuli var. vulneris]|uniref:Signal peptide peptidase n=1 Tax=Candidozyma haemuli TaxID=45357 RepID=A0A2V1AXE6_9ASCO|nr:hypothetical protein CXQ85_005084 [[Candida] haemuloni]KAF3992262.1 hypothetical protein FT662_01279 [[Candida] haemuloni var. vulneris]KAF3994641.1 hypothetical protein FT663_01219 [[Candida] haemuloni var. vulneris]PVH22515.1 hypothetical protein CXQ85_005084 [[Candida] haemuloni]